jgi:hypothetical protein
MPHVIASQQAASKASQPQPHPTERSREPTVREPSLERRRDEPQPRVGVQTLQLGSGLAPETPRTPAPVAASPLDATPREPEKPATDRTRGEVVQEALHDDFFDAGDQGIYHAGDHEGGPVPIEDELEPDLPRLIVRTPEQEQRRARLMQVVGVVVGVVLGVFVFAILRGGSSGDDKGPASDAPVEVEQPPAPPAPPPPPPGKPVAPADVTPPPPPAELPPVVDEPEPAAAPAPKPAAEKPPSEKPAAEKPAGEAAPAPKLRPAPEPVAPRPATQPRPAGPLPPPIPTGKPPTVSFPD